MVSLLSAKRARGSTHSVSAGGVSSQLQLTNFVGVPCANGVLVWVIVEVTSR